MSNCIAKSTELNNNKIKWNKKNWNKMNSYHKPWRIGLLKPKIALNDGSICNGFKSPFNLYKAAWSIDVFSSIVLSGLRSNFFVVLTEIWRSEFRLPPKFPLPTRNVTNWFKATFSFFSLNISTFLYHDFKLLYF